MNMTSVMTQMSVARNVVKEGAEGRPPMSRMTWIDTQSRTWRVEQVAGRWQLSLYWPSTDTWQRVSSWPTRMDAVQAAQNPDER
jgi:hypothetical protein